MEWNAADEAQLFLTMNGLKPVGINKYFNIACIAETMSRKLNRDISTYDIWFHLRTMYNLDALENAEHLELPNEPIDFLLPEEFSSFMAKKRAESTGDDENRGLCDLNNPAVEAAAVTPGKGLANATGKDGGDKKANANTIPKRAVATRTRGTSSGDSKLSLTVVSAKRRRT